MNRKKIKKYLKKIDSLKPFKNMQLQTLKTELDKLKKKFYETYIKKDKYLKKIDSFYVGYYSQLGELIKTVLTQKQTLLKRELEKNREEFEKEKKIYEELKSKLNKISIEIQDIKGKLNSIDDFDDEYDEVYKKYEKLKNRYIKKEKELNKHRHKAKEIKKSFEKDINKREYETLKKDFEIFMEDYFKIKDRVKEINKLSESDEKTFQDFYKKNLEICVPKLLNSELEKEAIYVLRDLNEVYKTRDLKKIKFIWENLKSGLILNSTSRNLESNNKEGLRVEIVKIESKIDEIEQEIEIIESNKMFLFIKDINLNDYFDEVEIELEEEKKELGKRLNLISKI